MKIDILYNNKYIILFLIILFIFIIFIYYKILKNIKKKKIKNAKKMINILKQNKNCDDFFINFPKYYINLDKSKDRNNNMINQIQNYKIKNIKRISAFNGNDIKSIKNGIINGYKYYNKNDNNLTKNELAITMSHLYAIYIASNEGNENVIIFEDDVEFTLAPYWKKNLNNIINELPKNTDILSLTYKFINNDMEIINNKYVNGVAYLVTKKGMEKCKKLFDGKTFNFNNKCIIWDIGILQNYLNTYSLSTPMFLYDNFKYSSTRINQNYHFCNESYKILNNYYKNE